MQRLEERESFWAQGAEEEIREFERPPRFRWLKAFAQEVNAWDPELGPYLLGMLVEHTLALASRLIARGWSLQDVSRRARSWLMDALEDQRIQVDFYDIDSGDVLARVELPEGRVISCPVGRGWGLEFEPFEDPEEVLEDLESRYTSFVEDAKAFIRAKALIKEIQRYRAEGL